MSGENDNLVTSNPLFNPSSRLDWIQVGRYWVNTRTRKVMPVVQGGGPATTVQNDKYAFGDDDGTESGHSLDTENTNRTAQSADVTFMFRVQIEETAGGSEVDGYMLYAQKNGTGGFSQIPYSTTNNGLRLNNDTQSRADDENTTERLSYGGASSFATGHYDDGTSAVGTGSISLDQDNTGYTDLEFALYIDSANASDSDYWELRVHFDGGGALDGYPASLPTVTASISAAPQTVNCNAGTLTITGQTADVDAPVTIDCAVGALTAGGQQATVTAPPLAQQIDCQVGALTAGGQQATVTSFAPQTVNCAAGTLTAGGQQADVYVAQTISASIGALTATGVQADVYVAQTIACAAGTLTATGQQADVSTPVGGQQVDCAVGALTATGKHAAVAPFDVTGLSAWWDFSDAATMFTDAGTTPVSSDADLIYQINDKIGNGKNATQTTEANRPVYKTGIQNSLSVGRGNGTSQYLEFTLLTLTTHTLVGVWKYNALDDSVVGDDDDTRFEASSSSTMTLRFSGASGVIQDVSSDPTSGFYVWGQTWAGSGNALKLYQNGSEQDSDNLTVTNADWRYLFTRRNNLSFLDGDIGELLIFDGVSADLENIFTYLNNKWSVYAEPQQIDCAVGALTITGQHTAIAPFNVTSLEAWYDFADIGSLYQDSTKATAVASDADPIGAAEDKSGGGHDVTQATSTKRFAFKTGIQNGNSVGRVDASDDNLKSAAFSALSQPNTIFIVVKCAAESGLRIPFDGLVDTNRHVMWYPSGNTSDYQVFAGNTWDTNTAANGNFQIIAILYNTTSSQMWVNGNSIGTGNVGTHTLTGITLGAYYSGATAALGGDIGEFLLFDGNISGAQFTGILDYLNDKWSVYAEVDCAAGTLTLAGQQATVTSYAPQTVSASAGTLTLTGQQATVTSLGPQTIDCQAGTLTLTGQSATIITDQTISASTGTLSLTGQSAAIVVYINWWEANGVTGCIQALQPTGANSYTVSLTDRSGNDNDASEGVAPDWDSTNGWKFNGSDDYLDTGITPASGYSAIVRWSNVPAETDGVIFGETTDDENVDFRLATNNQAAYANWAWSYGDNSENFTGAASGVFAIAGTNGYLDGVSVGTAGTWGGGSPITIYLGGNHYSGLSAPLPVYIQAFAIYSGTLTADEVYAVSFAMERGLKDWSRVICAAGTLTLSGQQATISSYAPQTVSCQTGTLTLTGQQANISLGSGPQTVNCQVGALTITGQSADVDAPVTISAAIGTLTITGQQATIDAPVTIDAGVGSLSITGQQATILAAQTISAAVGALTLTGQSADIDAAVTIDCAAGSLTLTGQTASVDAPVTIDCATGTLTLTGQQAALLASVAILEAWTLQARDLDLTVESRGLEWTVLDRTTAWTVEDK